MGAVCQAALIPEARVPFTLDAPVHTPPQSVKFFHHILAPTGFYLKTKTTPPQLTTYISAFQTIKAMHTLYEVYTVKNVRPPQYTAPTKVPLPGGGHD